MQSDLKELLKRVSTIVGDISQSLEDYVNDEKNEKLKKEYENQISDARKLDEDIIEIIGKLSRSELNSK